MNQRLKVTKFGGPHSGDHANWAPPNFKIFSYQILQLDILSFKSTGRLISGKDKT